MFPSLQNMINYLKFEPHVSYSARKFARGVESYYYFHKQLTEKQLMKIVEIYNEKFKGE